MLGRVHEDDVIGARQAVPASSEERHPDNAKGPFFVEDERQA
jgi:hypothetical protein